MRRPAVFPRRRAAPFGVLLGVAATSALGGCTFLVDFVTKATPSDCDGAPCADAASSDALVPPGDTTDARLATDTDASGSDAALQEAECSNPCRDRITGWYCGMNGLSCAAPANDLYSCAADATADVTHCTQGAGCLQLPGGHPDTCDPCPFKPDGTYCGSDLSGLVPQTPEEATYLFACRGGRIELTSKVCTNGCGGTPPNARCN